MHPRIPVLPAAAIGFCCVGLVTAFIGLRDVVGTGSTAKLWLVLLVAAGIAALVLLRTARDERGRVRLGVGWAVLGAVVIGVTMDRTPSPAPGVPVSSGWAVLVAGGAAVLVGGVLLAVSPLVRAAANRLVVAVVLVVVCGIQVAGYAGALSWTNGQNVNLSVADATPLTNRRVVLDGRMQWSSTVAGVPVASVGGVLVAMSNGLLMLDPSTGKPRWTYRRADLATMYEPVASSDGTEVAVIGFEPNPNPQDAPTRRLLVLNATSGAVLTDTLLDPNVQGDLAAVGATDAYFSGAPDERTTVQVGAVRLTGKQAGRQDWVYVSKDHCQINEMSTLGAEVALSTTCGTVAMLDQNGTPRWTYHAHEGGAQIWPLAGSPAGTVQLVAGPGTVSNPRWAGISVPSAVVSLDARTGALRWQAGLPTAPFAADSQDAAGGTLATIWAGSTATLVYQLPQSRSVWLVGIGGTTPAAVWSTVVPNLSYPLGLTAQNIGQFVAATPDGRILLPAQNSESASDLNSHPNVIAVDGRDGSVKPNVVINGSRGIPGQSGFYSPPSALPTPGGVVLAIAGSAPPSDSDQGQDLGQLRYLLVGLR